MENQNCIDCGRKDTKYSCIACNRKICNVCSKPSLPNEIGYSEENYMIAKCSDCNKGVVEVLDEAKENPGILSKETPKFCKKGERQLKLDFFRKKTHVNDDDSEVSEGKLQVKTSISTVTKEKMSTKRGLSLATAEKWKTSHLVLYDPEQWLFINADKKGKVLSLQCKICNKYANQIESIKNSASDWALYGSTNLQVSNAKRHATGDPHKEAMRLHYKVACANPVEVAANFRNDKSQCTIQSGIHKMNLDDLERMKKKFDIAYFIAKEELPLSNMSL